jgi:ribA/ribD-fused uncharacterized protein
MERGIQEPAAVESLIDIANRDSNAEFEVKLLAGKIQTRDVAERLLKAIETMSVGEFVEEHRLTYSFPEGMRVSVVDPQNIHKICVSQSFKGLPVLVERKVKYFDSTAGRDMVDAPEVLTRFTLRSEKPIKKDFDGDVNDPKAHIRVLHRKSYKLEGGEFRVDFSMVKSRIGKQTLREVLKNVPGYEFEIEYLPRKPARKASEVRESLYRICETILQAYLESAAILLQSEIQKYSQEFKFTGIRFYNIVSMDRVHISPDRPNNILKGYTVTNKADGIRAGLYVARDRKLLRISRGGEHIAWTGLIAVDDKHAEDFLDGEFIENKNLFCIFDVFRYKNKDVKALPLFTTDEDIRANPGSSRLGCAREFVKTMNTDFRTVVSGFRVETKLFLAGDGPAMEEAIQTLLDTEFEYHTDGLIFTPRSSPVMPPTESKGKTWLRVYKWKPPHQNTIDFLLKFDDSEPVYDAVTERMTRKASLFVSRTPGEDIVYPCEAMTGEYIPPELPADLQRIADMRDRVPAVFQPSAPRDPDAYQIWIPINRKKIAYDLEENRVEDNTVVECSYDMDIGRWSVMRTRYDKTFEYRVLRRPQFGNDINVADNIWTLIHVPVTEKMLRNVVSNPGDDTFEDDAYYKDEGSRESVTKNLRGFHNRVKEGLYMNYIVPNNTLFELAVGRAGDLFKWIKAKASKVFGIDVSSTNFRLPRSGACVRYINEKKKGTRGLPKVLFAEGNMSKPFEEQNSRYLKIMLGTEEASTPYLQEFKGVQYWDVMACQFAIHYACESEEMFKVFVQNVKNHCKSVFFGTCMDGKSVFSLLSGRDRYILRSSGRAFAQIDKKYNDEGEWKPEFGQGIDVTLESTDKPMREYLVPFERVVELFGEAGFELLESKMFQELYTGQSGISLDDAQQEYTFLHRTFAFKRTDAVSAEPKKEEIKPIEEVDVEEEVIKVIEEKKKDDSGILFFFSKEPENKEFSSFFDTTFKIDDIEYKNAEQAFQAIRAKTFGDDDSFNKILKSKSAQSAKSFGNKIEKFDEEVWNAQRDTVMRSILRAKFSQNPAIRKQLLDSGNGMIANADPRENYWGIGTSAGTSIAKNPAKWKGKNMMGKLLMELRSELRAEDDADEAAAGEEEEEEE